MKDTQDTKELEFADQPQNQPFYNKIADLSLSELKALGEKTILDFKKGIKVLEKSEAKDEDLLREIDVLENSFSEDHFMSTISLVHPKKEFRDLADEFSIKTSEAVTEYSLNQQIYKRFNQQIDPKNLSPQAAYLYDLLSKSYKRTGVDKPEKIRSQVKQVSKKMSELSTKFSKNVAENTPVLKFKSKELNGCLKSFIKAKTNKSGEIEIKLIAESTLHILQNCTVRETREKVREISMNYAKDLNGEILPEYLNKAEELAKLLGYKNYAWLATEDKMIENPENSAKFINQLISLTRERAQKELSLIKKYKSKSGDNTELSYADIDYYSNQIAIKLTNSNEEELKEYFPYQHVKESLLQIFEEMFGIEFKQDKSAKVWNDDVDCYQVFEDGKTIGRIYLDMHPRDGKFNHACSSGVVMGLKERVLPQNLLICNFTKPTKTDPGLQSIDEVNTFFHEFGHLLHHTFGGQNGTWSDLSGWNVQDDFVEAPSQLLEEILMDSKVLKKLSKHIETSEQIPDELILKVQRKQSIMDGPKLNGIAVARQASLSKMSLEVYTTTEIDNLKLKEIEQGSSRDALGVYGDYYSIYHFGHILRGYSSNYYTYMWSLAIAKDLFTKFNSKNLLDREVANKYRKTILEPGGSKPVKELVEDFLGREWNMDAFKAYLKEGEELLK